MDQNRRRSVSDAVSPPPLKRLKSVPNPPNGASNFFTPTSKKPPKATTWRSLDNSLLCARYDAGKPANQDSPVKVAAFDLDSTLIVTRSGKKFPNDRADWKWWDTCVPERVQQLCDEGFRVVIFSNQGGLSLRKDAKSAKTDQKRLDDFKFKIEVILDSLQRNISIYAATQSDKYRKPRLGMWHEMIDDLGLGAADTIDMNQSMFVGDAGGRLNTDGHGSADFSCSDRNFAANAGLRYHTPEEFFLGSEPRIYERTFDPTAYLAGTAGGHASSLLTTAEQAWIKGEKLELVVLCGSPGSGKSTYYWNHLEPLGYARVNQDLLKTRERCIKRATELLSQGQPVVVDNTNADVETRAAWVRLGQAMEATVRCARMQTDPRVCEHNNAVRALNADMNPEQRQMLPRIAFNTFTSRLREPRLDEGFADIVQVDFHFAGSTQQRMTWCQYWL